MSELKQIIGAALDKFKGDMTPADVEKVNENLDGISELIETVEDVFGDGIQLSDVSRIGEIVGPAMSLAATFKDYEGEDKKRFVIDTVWLVYRAVDTFPDGNSNNINIPFLAGGFETKVEKILVEFAAGMAVNALYKRMKDAGEV